jgi:hypothetical protein
MAASIRIHMTDGTILEDEKHFLGGDRHLAATAGAQGEVRSGEPASRF